MLQPLAKYCTRLQTGRLPARSTGHSQTGNCQLKKVGSGLGPSNYEHFVRYIVNGENVQFVFVILQNSILSSLEGLLRDLMGLHEVRRSSIFVEVIGSGLLFLKFSISSDFEWSNSGQRWSRAVFCGSAHLPNSFVFKEFPNTQSSSFCMACRSLLASRSK